MVELIHQIQSKSKAVWSHPNLVLLSICLFAGALITASLLLGTSSLFLPVAASGALVVIVLVKPLAGLIVYILTAPLGQLLGVWSTGPVNVQHFLGVLVPFATLIRTSHRFASLPRVKFPVVLLAVALVLTVSFGSVTGRQAGAYWLAILAAGHLAMFFTTLALCDSTSSQKVITAAILFGGVLAALLNLYAYFGDPQLFTAAGIEVFDFRKGRFTGLSPNPNALSTAFVLVLPLTYAAAASRRGLMRYASLTATGVCLLVLAIAASRSALLGSAIGAVLFFSATIRRNLKRYVVLLLFMVILIASLAHLLPDHPVAIGALERFQESLSDEGFGGRPEAITATLRMIWENPMGVGLGAVSSQIHEYGFTEISNPHNTVLATGASLGWLGLSALLWLLAIQAMDGWRVSMRVSTHPFGVALFSGIVAYWVHASFHAVLHFGFLWVYFALAARVWNTRVSLTQAAAE